MAGGAEMPIKPTSPSGPRARLHRAQQGATNRAGIWIDHNQRAVPYSLSHTGQIASQPRATTSRLKRRAMTAGVSPLARLSQTWPAPGHSLRASGGEVAMGNTMPRSPDGSRSMELEQDRGLQFEKLKERQAHPHDALKVRWQSGINSKVSTPQAELWKASDGRWSKAPNIAPGPRRASVPSSPLSPANSDSDHLLRRSQHLKGVRDSHFHPTAGGHRPATTSSGQPSRDAADKGGPVPKLSKERLRESNDFAHSPTNREKQAFGIHGWGCAATVKFDAFPTSTFEPDTSFLLTQRIAARDQNPAATGAYSPTSTRHLAAHPEEVVEWDGFTEQTTSRLKKESAAAEQRIERMTRGKGSAAANQARGMNDLQLSIAKKYANADAVTMISDAEHAQGHMKGVMGKQSNFMRPFSPANFSILTESKLGRPAGTAPIGMGLTAPAGLPSDLRYNHAPDALEARDYTQCSKGFNNRAFPSHSGHHIEGYLRPQVVPAFGGHLVSPDKWRKLPDGGTRPSFDKGVEYDGPIAPGKRARDLTIYNTYNGMTN